jgi:hypothetical protein
LGLRQRFSCEDVLGIPLESRRDSLLLDKIRAVFGQALEASGIHWNAITDLAPQRSVALQVLQHLGQCRAGHRLSGWHRARRTGAPPSSRSRARS